MTIDRTQLADKKQTVAVLVTKLAQHIRREHYAITFVYTVVTMAVPRYPNLFEIAIKNFETRENA